MKPRNKAIKLHNEFYKIFNGLGSDDILNDYAKRCVTLICDDYINGWFDRFNSEPPPSVEFWIQVKEEIKSL